MAVATGVAVVMGLGCGSEEPQAPAKSPAMPEASPQPGGPDVASAESEAREIFESRCVTCHGARGGGDGPASKGLTPPPRNFQDPAWQASVDDAHIEKIIKYGGAAVGRSAAMPANPDLTAKPQVVAALRALIRGLAEK
jgi:mono/diheme cytochrome c family protein